MSQQPDIIIEERSIPRGRLFSDLPYDEGPQFRITEMCKFFFNRTSHWLRWLEEEDPETNKPNYLVVGDAPPVAQRRTVSKDPERTGARIFGLRDVEDLSYALLKNKRIPPSQMRNILILLVTLAQVHGVGVGEMADHDA